MLNHSLEFCPVPETVKSLYCKLVEGQLVSLAKPCPHRTDCCQLIEDLAGCYANAYAVESTSTHSS